MFLLLHRIKLNHINVLKIRKLSIVISIFLYVVNLYGLQLGDNSKKNQYTPIKVMENVKSVSVDNLYSVIIKNDNTLWGTGILSDKFINSKKTVGTDKFIFLSKDIESNLKNFCIDKNGTLKSIYSNDGSLLHAKIISVTDNVDKIESRNYLTAVLKKDKSLWIKGKKLVSIDYQYNYSDPIEELEYVDKDVISMSCANNILIYIKKDNSVWAIGDNLDKKLINSFDRVLIKPVQIAKKMKDCFIGDKIYLISKKNKLYTISRGALVIQDSNVKEIQKCFYLKTDGSLYGYGYACYGSLGVGESNNSKLLPTYVMGNVKKVKGNEYHSLILTNDNKLYSCGGGRCNFGCNGDGTNKKRSVPVMIMDDVKDFDISNYHSMVIKNDKSLWAFGLNNIDEYELYE